MGDFQSALGEFLCEKYSPWFPGYWRLVEKSDKARLQGLAASKLYNRDPDSSQRPGL